MEEKEVMAVSAKVEMDTFSKWNLMHGAEDKLPAWSMAELQGGAIGQVFA